MVASPRGFGTSSCRCGALLSGSAAAVALTLLLVAAMVATSCAFAVVDDAARLWDLGKVLGNVEDSIVEVVENELHTPGVHARGDFSDDDVDATWSKLAAQAEHPFVAAHGDDKSYPLPFTPRCGSGAAVTLKSVFKPPTTHAVDAYVTVPAEACSGNSELPIIILHHGFFVPTMMYKEYARLIAGFGGFAVVQYNAGNFVSDPVLAYEWLNPLVDWVKAREEDGSLDGFLAPGASVNATRIGVVGHSRGGNIAALQLNSTRPETEKVVSAYLIDPVGCGTRMAACGFGTDGRLNVGWYRAGWDAIQRTDRKLMLSAAGHVNMFNNVVCTCTTDKIKASGKCPIWIGPRCNRDHHQTDLYFGASPTSTMRITVDFAKHWDFAMQPVTNITAASAVSWLSETVGLNSSFKDELGDYLLKLQAEGLVGLDQKQDEERK